MAKIQNTLQNISNTFVKGLNKDSDPSFVTEGMWIHARNATNNTSEGNLGTLSNEAANILCVIVGNTMPIFGANAVTDVYIIGAIHLFSDKWIIYSVGHALNGKPVMSEIGLLDEDRCVYRPIVQEECLGFDKRFLILGSSREMEDCSWQVYWADGLNPDRYLNVGDPQTWPSNDYEWQLNTISNSTPAVYNLFVNQYVSSTGDLILWPGVSWIEDCSTNINCTVCDDTNKLDCDRIRLARLVETPCLTVQRGESGGTLRNGTYFAVIAYLIKGQRVTDYFSPSNTQPIYFPDDLQGAITINVNADEYNFDEFILVVIQNINQGTVAKQIGIYSTRTSVIELDQIKDDLITVPLELIPITNPIYETSDQITDVNNYLLRVGPRTRFDFNYQPLANLIRSKWVSIEYPADYYMKGGNKGSYLRDEVYTFFIRWVYNTGDKSASYHIPGRPPKDYSYILTGTNTTITANERSDSDHDVNTLTNTDQLFEMYNTANINGVASILGTTTNDGGTVIASGEMGYWESSEIYPDNQPDIWNSSTHCWTGSAGHANFIDPVTNQDIYINDLCGLNIRYHKFPDNYLNDKTLHYKPSNSSVPGDSNTLNIRIMGIVFEDIALPKDNDGNDIPGIVGYEILRGSREGNKSIIAKGMLNNMRTYKIKGDVARNRTGLYPNYPFNCIRTPMNTGNAAEDNFGLNDPYIYSDNNYNQNVPIEINTFHSPDTMFRTPFLEGTELKLYGAVSGFSFQSFKFPDEHPKFKLISDAAMGLALLIGFAEALVSLTGKTVMKQPGASFTTQPVVNQISTAPGVTLTNPASPFYEAPNQIAQTTIKNTDVGNPSGLSLPTIPGLPAPFFTRLKSYFSQGNLITNVFTGTNDLNRIFEDFNFQTGFKLGGTFTAPEVDVELSAATYLEDGNLSFFTVASNVLGALNKFFYYFSEGADATLNIIYAFLPFDQYALQMIAHGLYDSFLPPAFIQRASQPYVTRLKVDDAFYIRGNIQEVPYYQSQFPFVVDNRYSINNLKRSDSVVLRTISGPLFQPAYPNGVDLGPKFILNTSNKFYDQSLVTMSYFNNNASGSGNAWGNIPGPSFDDNNISTPFSLPIASHYGAIKVRKRNQYGQLESVKQIPITPCEQKLDSSYYTNHIWPEQYTCSNGIQYTINKITLTPLFFGGDTFVNRYTEKNSMFFFYDWLYGQPDGYEFNYLLRQMIPEPKFWVNSTKYDVSDFSNILTQFFNGGTTPGTGWKPTNFYSMDYRGFNYRDSTAGNYPGIFRPKDCYFYLAVSSVRDFFVESEVLVDFRIQGVTEAEKYYDPYGYTDLISMFNMDPQIITRGNEYRYDYSLSITKAFSQYFSAGNLQSRYYNPLVAKLCYTYYPDRIIYSLPQQQEAFKDSWFIYLVNNYKEFQTQISGVKSINKNGLVITFKNSSPLMFQGVDTLQTDLGTKITIGDGGLFSQPGQSLINADPSFEYGSSQNRLSVISTPAGIYYISQNQGKIFSLGSNLKEISQIGLKWWFNNFLPYKLTDDFPDYPYQDNPVSGIGCQSLYDNENSILYFSKRDYKLLEKWKAPTFAGNIIYVPLITSGIKKGQGDYFQIQNPNGVIQPGIYQLGNPLLFEDSSWTISYDPKNDFWLSYHDWHPDLSIGTKSVFLTTKKNGIWKHNEGCTSFCNFYGDQYPFEIELPIITGQTVTTVKSIEYILECYRRRPQNCIDQFHVLDYNFDRAVVYNSEQVSGFLNLNIFPKNNVTLSETFPKLNQSNLASFDILFSKEENKYRFNQFWDITRDRSEFPIGSDYPPTGPLVTGTTVLQGNYADRNIWFTESNGYKRTLNPTNLDYNKSELQRKKFRHYINYLTLIRENSFDTNMILKIVNSKNQISLR